MTISDDDLQFAMLTPELVNVARKALTELTVNGGWVDSFELRDYLGAEGGSWPRVVSALVGAGFVMTEQNVNTGVPRLAAS